MAKNPSLAAACFLLGASGNLPRELLTKTTDNNIIKILKDYAADYCYIPDDMERPSWFTTCSKGSAYFKLLFKALLILILNFRTCRFVWRFTVQQALMNVLQALLVKIKK